MDRESSHQPNRLIRILKWIAGTVLAGCIGSGCWEWLIAPALKWSGNKLLALLSFTSEKYADNLHARIAIETTQAGLEDAAALGSAFLSILPIGLYIMLLAMFRMRRIQRRRLSNEQLEKPENVPAVFKFTNSLIDKSLDFLEPWESTILSSFVAILFLWTNWMSYLRVRDMYTRSASIYIERSIAILGPVISPTEKLKFEADYRAIESAKDFHSLQDRLLAKSKDTCTKIPEFRAMGRKKD